VQDWYSFRPLLTENVRLHNESERKCEKKSKKKKKGKKKKSGPFHPKNSHAIDHETLKDIISKSNVDDQFDRIHKILDVEDVEDENNAAVNYENLGKYLAYLKNDITFPIIVTGIEDLGCFGWEEYYTLGPGSQKEYEKLKKKYPSFSDEYELLSFDEDFNEDEGLCVKVRRISDSKKFSLTLADLETVETNSANAQLLEDYAVWHTNFR
jgi:hypothetical protein